VSDDTAAGPTLGEAYWRGFTEGGPYDGLAYRLLDEDDRKHIEAGAAAAGAAAIARLNQPAELAAAMAERDKYRELVSELRAALLVGGQTHGDVRRNAIGIIERTVGLK
jgi:hypothetical protein